MALILFDVTCTCADPGRNPTGSGLTHSCTSPVAYMTTRVTREVAGELNVNYLERKLRRVSFFFLERSFTLAC